MSTTKGPHLYLSATGEALREATPEELSASEQAAERDGGTGIIFVEGFRCYALDFGRERSNEHTACDLCAARIADDTDVLLRTRAAALVTACEPCAERFVALGYGRRTDTQEAPRVRSYAVHDAATGAALEGEATDELLQASREAGAVTAVLTKEGLWALAPVGIGNELATRTVRIVESDQ